MNHLKRLLTLFKIALKNMLADNVFTLSSSLAYSSIFSIAPLLIITMGVVGTFYGSEESGRVIFDAIQDLVGPEGSKAIEEMVRASAKKPQAGFFATVTGVVILIMGAAGVFQQLQQSFNIIWKVRPKPTSGLRNFFRLRLLSFSMVISIAFLLLISLFISAGLAILGTYWTNLLPGGQFLWHSIHLITSFFIITFLFAAIFKVLPDIQLTWRNVLPGAALTAFLFNVGKIVIGLYLAHESVTSTYGAVGSLVVVLLWVYYSSVIVFFGVEVTRAYVIQNQIKIQPIRDAELISVKVEQTG